MNLNRKVISVLATSFALVAPLALKAGPILIGVPVIATGGDVKAKFVSSNAGDTDLLHLVMPTTFGTGTVIFNNQTTPTGTIVDLGVYAPGTELVFEIVDVSHSPNTLLFSGDASRNADGFAHASLSDLGGGVTLVGFEDLLASQGSDFDYNDLEFSFTNTRVGKNGGVPDATGTAGLMLAGLALVGAAAFKRRR